MKRTKTSKPKLINCLAPCRVDLDHSWDAKLSLWLFRAAYPSAIGLAITSVVGIKLGLKWKDIEKGIFRVISVALPSVSVFK